MNHEIICKYCGKDQRLKGLDCCREYKFQETKRKFLEKENYKELKKILDSHNIYIYNNDSGQIIIPRNEIEKLINLLGG